MSCLLQPAKKCLEIKTSSLEGGMIHLFVSRWRSWGRRRCCIVIAPGGPTFPETIWASWYPNTMLCGSRRTPRSQLMTPPPLAFPPTPHLTATATALPVWSPWTWLGERCNWLEVKERTERCSVLISVVCSVTPVRDPPSQAQKHSKWARTHE